MSETVTTDTTQKKVTSLRSGAKFTMTTPTRPPQKGAKAAQARNIVTPNQGILQRARNAAIRSSGSKKNGSRNGGENPPSGDQTPVQNAATPVQTPQVQSTEVGGESETERVPTETGGDGGAVRDSDHWQTAPEESGAGASGVDETENTLGVGDEEREGGNGRFIPLSSTHIDEVLKLIEKPRGEVEKAIMELFKLNSDSLSHKEWNLLQARYTQAELIVLVGFIDCEAAHKGSELRSLRIEVESVRKKRAHVLEVKTDYEKAQADFSAKIDAFVGIAESDLEALMFDKSTMDVYSAMQDHILGTGRLPLRGEPMYGRDKVVTSIPFTDKLMKCLGDPIYNLYQ